jgi:hypothetical protein
MKKKKEVKEDRDLVLRKKKIKQRKKNRKIKEKELLKK